MRRAGGEGGRAGGRAAEQFDVAQLRAGGHDRADAVGGGHATRESRRSPLWSRRAKAAMSGAAISHLWAVIGVAVKRCQGWIRCVSCHWWAGLQQQRSKRGKKLDSYFDCRLSRHTVLGPDEKLAGGRAQRVGATPTGRAPRLGPSARGPPRRGAPRAHGRPARAEDGGPRIRSCATKRRGGKGGGSSMLHHSAPGRRLARRTRCSNE